VALVYGSPLHTSIILITRLVCKFSIIEAIYKLKDATLDEMFLSVFSKHPFEVN